MASTGTISRRHDRRWRPANVEPMWTSPDLTYQWDEAEARPVKKRRRVWSDDGSEDDSGADGNVETRPRKKLKDEKWLLVEALGPIFRCIDFILPYFKFPRPASAAQAQAGREKVRGDDGRTSSPGHNAGRKAWREDGTFTPKHNSRRPGIIKPTRPLSSPWQDTPDKMSGVLYTKTHYPAAPYKPSDGHDDDDNDNTHSPPTLTKAGSHTVRLPGGRTHVTGPPIKQQPVPRKDSHGRLIDTLGRLINKRGQLINEKGQLVDEYGRIPQALIKAPTHVPAKVITAPPTSPPPPPPPSPPLPPPPKPPVLHVDEEGRLRDEQSRLVNEQGHLVNKAGQLVNEAGHIVDKHGRIPNQVFKDFALKPKMPNLPRERPRPPPRTRPYARPRAQPQPVSRIPSLPTPNMPSQPPPHMPSQPTSNMPSQAPSNLTTQPLSNIPTQPPPYVPTQPPPQIPSQPPLQAPFQNPIQVPFQGQSQVLLPVPSQLGPQGSTALSQQQYSTYTQPTIRQPDIPSEKAPARVETAKKPTKPTKVARLPPGWDDDGDEEDFAMSGAAGTDGRENPVSAPTHQLEDKKESMSGEAVPGRTVNKNRNPVPVAAEKRRIEEDRVQKVLEHDREYEPLPQSDFMIMTSKKGPYGCRLAPDMVKSRRRTQPQDYEEFLMSGAAGPSGTINKNGIPYPVPAEEKAQFLKEREVRRMPYKATKEQEAMWDADAKAWDAAHAPMKPLSPRMKRRSQQQTQTEKLGELNLTKEMEVAMTDEHFNRWLKERGLQEMQAKKKPPVVEKLDEDDFLEEMTEEQFMDSLYGFSDDEA